MADVIEITIPNGITYSLKDATAVKFVEQTLTDAQKAQARANIGAKSDTDELVLGHISGIVLGSNNAYSFKLGFKDLGLATSNTTSISFPASAIDTWQLVNKYKIVQFEDFVGVLAKNTDTSFKVGPLPDRADGISMAGQWIHVKGCYNMFNGCSGLTSLDLSAFDTSKVRTMRSMFTNCSGLTSLDLSKFDTSNVIDMYAMFSGCSGLTSLGLLGLSSFDTSKVKNMQAMFSSCSGLTSLNLSTFDTSKVTSMVGMFNACRSLTSLDISSFDMSKVTDANTYNMFNGTTALTVLKTPKINQLTNIDLPKTMYSQSGTAYTKLPVTTGTSIELRTSWA